MYRLPRVFSIVSGCYLLAVVAWFLSMVPAGELRAETVFDVVLILIPGLTFLYVGLRLPVFDIEPRNYPMLIGWVLAGVGAMVVFLLLRVLHPGVDADWTVGTQAIAFTIGSVGGLLIGLQQTRAVTRAQQLERRNEDLAARKRELAHQNRRLDRFTGVVSHDLRSPLAATVGWIEMAKSDCEADYLTEATAGLDRMGTIIDHTLELAKQGRTVASFEPVDFAELVTDCWRMTTTDDEGLTIHGTATISGDPDRLRHLFENLFRNAIEHGSQDAVISIGALEDGFYVEDNGTGIPEAERERITERGYSTSSDGTGLGLAIVQEIADSHGWQLRATDSTTGGARFELTGVEFVT